MAKIWSFLSLILIIGAAIWWVNASYMNPQQRSQTETTSSSTPVSQDTKKEAYATLEWKGDNRFEYTIHNGTEQPITLPFRSGQRYEYYVKDQKGHRIDTYSEGKMFTQEVTEKTIQPGETYKEKIMISSPPPGSYTLEVESASSYQNKFKQTVKFKVEDQDHKKGEETT